MVVLDSVIGFTEISYASQDRIGLAGRPTGKDPRLPFASNGPINAFGDGLVSFIRSAKFRVHGFEIGCLPQLPQLQ